jgi:hypothetical protein
MGQLRTSSSVAAVRKNFVAAFCAGIERRRIRSDQPHWDHPKKA